LPPPWLRDGTRASGARRCTALAAQLSGVSAVKTVSGETGMGLRATDLAGGCCLAVYAAAGTASNDAIKRQRAGHLEIPMTDCPYYYFYSNTSLRATRRPAEMPGLAEFAPDGPELAAPPVSKSSSPWSAAPHTVLAAIVFARLSCVRNMSAELSGKSALAARAL